MYVYKTVSPIVVYILQNIQTCPKIFTQMTEEYENNYEDSYFLDYLPVPEMSTNIQGETLIEDLEYMPSCSHNHENQVGQSKFPQIVPDGEYLESDELLDSSLISSPTTIDTFQYPCTSALSISSRRSIDEVKRYRTVTLPIYIPTGPWESPELAKLQLNDWALNLNQDYAQLSTQ